MVTDSQSRREQLLAYMEAMMIIVGLVLLLIGFIASIPILWTLGIIVLVIGLILMLLGRTGHNVGGRAHYF